MKRIFISFIILIIFLISGIYLLKSRNKSGEVRATISVAEVLSKRNIEGYARAISTRKINFPEDHGPHPEFQTEWWYYTGNLKTESGRHFSFQFTIFRNSISPDSLQRSSRWASNQVYMAHFALTDVENKLFHSFERFSRAANELAGARAKPFRVWLEDWVVESTQKDITIPFPAIRIYVAEKDISIDLNLKNTKPVVLHGDRGLSQKGSNPGNASYYYSLTRLNAQGQIKIKNNSYQVNGLAWLDREWSTSVLDDDQAGWDWFSLQLDDDQEIMYYQIRKRDGQPGKFSSGTIVEKDGTTARIQPEDINIDILEKWTSPSGSEYPSHWRINIPQEKMELEIIPYISNQELDVSIRYWEGAVRIRGTADGKSITGQGYVELTGY